MTLHPPVETELPAMPAAFLALDPVPGMMRPERPPYQTISTGVPTEAQL